MDAISEAHRASRVKNRKLTLRALLCLSMAPAVAEAKRGAVTLPACNLGWAAKGMQDFDGWIWRGKCLLTQCHSISDSRGTRASASLLCCVCLPNFHSLFSTSPCRDS